ncbi:MAG TPA: DoxX family protein [Candidatus Limnocylindrales bacterium]|nr:DoxX family protein [Candidatus Limnocylindrales bacterium]
MRPSELHSPFDRVDAAVTSTLARIGVPVLRIGLGVIFLWFGVLKFVPDLSPAQELATRTISALTFGTVGPDVSLPVLAAWETAIGLGLISGWFLRATLFLLAVQMLGTLMPLVLFPGDTFLRFPFAPTLEGQYIIKNVVLIGAAMVVGATVRGGRLVADPRAARTAAVVEAVEDDRRDRTSSAG